MAIRKNNVSEKAWNDSPQQAQEETHIRIRVKIPKQYHQEPVISRLVSRHGLTVNIKAAILGAHAPGDGWFDLELWGTSPRIQEGLAYLQIMNIRVWGKPNPDGDNPSATKL